MKLTKVIFKQLLEMLSYDDRESVLLDEFNMITNTRLFSINGEYKDERLIYASNQQEATRKYIESASNNDLVYHACNIDTRSKINFECHTCGVCKQDYMVNNSIGVSRNNHRHILHTREELSGYIFSYICLNMKLKQDIVV